MSRRDAICPALHYVRNNYKTKTVEEYIAQVEVLTGFSPSTEDATEQLGNLVGFFKVLTDWDQQANEKNGHGSSNDTGDQTPNAGGNGR